MSPHLLPSGYAARDATTDDAPEIASVINESNIAEVGIPWTSTEEVRDDLTSPGREVGDDVVLVSDEGALVGYLTLWADTEPFHRGPPARVRATGPVGKGTGLVAPSPR